MFRVRAIQVEHGDSLLVSYGTQSQLYHILVDGGPSGSLAALLSALKPERVDGLLKLEVLVVTHYDLDHIEGVIELLKEVPDWLDIGQIWFNGHHHLRPMDILGSLEGDSLSELIRSSEIPWNMSFMNQNCGTNSSRILQSSNAVLLPGGLDVKVLSPDVPGLMALARVWLDPAVPPKESGSIPGDLMGRRDKWPPEQHSLYSGMAFSSDGSVSNKSSIALLLTFGEKRVVLAADAYSKVVKAGLALHLPDGESIDLLKVSHHGSKGNTDKSLLDRLGCRRFLISTSGKTHKHPDHELIARLVARHDSPEIYFNYSEGWPGRWLNKLSSWPPFTARYPEGTNQFVDVML